MEYYETDDTFSRVEIDKFAKWLEDEIGTDYEINESASGEPDEFYIIVADLLPNEVRKIRKHEKELER